MITLSTNPSRLPEAWRIEKRLNAEAEEETRMSPSKRVALTILFLSSAVLCGCEDLVPQDTASLLAPHLQRSEIFGFLAGLGTTFAAFPDLAAMLKRRSTGGLQPRMAAILGVFQVLWVYYGFLIGSRPVIAWNVLAILINLLTVVAFAHFRRKEEADKEPDSTSTTLSTR